MAWRRQGVEADVQGVAVRDDVAGSGEGGADQGVGFVLTVAAVSREHSNRVQRSNFIERTLDETHRRVK
jgi:hypothetical protein